MRDVYHGYHMIAEYEVDESIISTKRTYTWGPDISGTYGGAGGIGGLWLINDFDSGESYIPGYDHQGNIILLYKIATGTGYDPVTQSGSNQDLGHVVAEYEYDPYGQLLRETGWACESSTSAWQPVSGDPTGNPFRYQTKWNIAEAYEITSHYNDRNMHLYDFGLRFYHPRHGRFINRDPIGEAGGLNLYAYAGNDPVNLGDFLGLDVIDGGTILISYPTGVSGDPFSDFANGFFDYDTVLLSKPRLPEVTIPEPDRNEASSSPSSQGSTRSDILSVHARSQVWMIARMRHSNTSSGGTSSRRRASPASSGHSAQREKRSVRGDVRRRELQNRDENYLSKSIWDPEGTLTSSEALVTFGEGYWDSVTGTPGKGASQVVYGGLWMIGGYYASTTPQGAVALSYGTAQTLGGFINLIGGIFGGPDFVEVPWFVPGSTDAQLEILQQYFQEEQAPPPGE